MRWTARLGENRKEAEAVVFGSLLPLGGGGAQESSTEMATAPELASAAAKLWARCKEGGRDGLRRLLHQLALCVTTGPCVPCLKAGTDA
jgi:hypothetical protein